MLPSPTSSLSSFRDYYHHTSDYSDEVPTSEQFITKGIFNFKIAKVFTKINWKLKQQVYWSLFYAFMKISRKAGRRQIRKKAMGQLGKILNKNYARESKIIIKCKYLNELLGNMKEKREIELRKLLYFGLKFMKKNYINAAICHYQVMKKLTTQKYPANQPPPENTKYILKLSKAILCISLRNLIDIKMSKNFREIKIGQYLKAKINPNQITFFKPKKQKVYQHRREGIRVQKMLKMIRVAQLIEIKCYKIFQAFLINIKPLRPHEQSSKSDDTDIFLNVTKHMIYLTGKASRMHQKGSLNYEKDIKQMKLALVIKNGIRRGRRILWDSILRWRRVANEQHLILKKQILKLQAIKKYYIDQM